MQSYEYITPKFGKTGDMLSGYFICDFTDSDICAGSFRDKPICLSDVRILHRFIFDLYDLSAQELGEVDFCRLHCSLVDDTYISFSPCDRVDDCSRPFIGSSVDSLGSSHMYAFCAKNK
ncbi:MAG TPA: hypothetical protein VIK53_04590 [Verrucomicrobiae bacterium]